MTATRPFSLACAAAVLVLSACSEATKPRVPIVPLAEPPVAPANGIAVYLTLSNPSPNPGETVIVTARALSGAQAKGVGSFSVRVLYDASQLTVGETKAAPDAMVAFNPVGGALVAAGASASGFATGELFHFTLTVQQPEALRSMSVEVREAISMAFADHRPHMLVNRGLVRDEATPR